MEHPPPAPDIALQALTGPSDTSTQPAPRLRSAVAAAPMVDTVGALRALLAQLPDEMPLSLGDHHRAPPDEENHLPTIHPRLVDVVSGIGTPAESTQSALMLTQVYVPFPAWEEEQAAVAIRDDPVPAYDELARVAHYMERGKLRPGLKNAAEVLDDLAHQMGEVGADFAEYDEDGCALRVEAKRLTHAAARVRKLADEVEAAE